ncbi:MULTISPECIES: AAA family ATPase [unclassified Carboxylicivirga]|uniref:AAA family ATPase n=1 Tax=Carboxylicivirga TaxID=1628153 RepID=UPI003D3504A1
MQLLKLYIKNLNSLKGEHTIDFCNGALGHTGLFAITGPTGAGKSTLLDAITLALYNQTPRSGAVSKNDIAQLGSIITRNTNESWAQLDYQIADATYRSQWGISRNRNGNLRDYSLVLSKQDSDGSFVPLDIGRAAVPQENTRLIGLSFDQFLRSILLSQGDFARFLKSNANERGELLEKITGTGIYRRIGRKCFERWRDEQEKLKHLKIQLEGIEIMSDEELATLRDEVAQMNTQSTQLESAITQGRQQYQLLKEYAALQESLKEMEVKQQELTRQKAAFASDEQRLSRHAKVLPLKVDLEALQYQKKRLDEIEKECNETTEALKSVKTETKLTQQELKELGAQQKQHANKRDAMAPKIKQCRQLDENIRAQQGAISRQKETCDEEGKVIEKLHNAVKKLALGISEQEQALSAVQTFINKNKHYEPAGEQLPLMRQQRETVLSSDKAFEDKLQALEPSPTRQCLMDYPSSRERARLLDEAIGQSEQFIREKSHLLNNDQRNGEQRQEELKQLQKQLRAVEKLIETLIEQKSLEKEVNTLEQNMTDSIAARSVCVAERKTLSQALEMNQKYLDELNSRRQRELLEAKYEDARRLLKPNEACPLCGSDQHPYVEHYENKVDETSLLLEERNEEGKQLKEKERQLIEKSTAFSASIESSEREAKRLAERKVLLSATLERVLPESQLMAEQLNDELLPEKREDLLSQIKKAEEQIKWHERLSVARARNKEFVALREQLLTLLTAKELLEQLLKPYGAGSDENSLSADIKSIERSYQQLKKQQEEQQGIEKALVAMQADWKAQSEQLKTRLTGFARCDAALKEMNGQLENLVTQRKELLGTQSCDELEQELKNAADKLQNEVQNKQQVLSGLETLIASHAERLATNEKLLEKQAQNYKVAGEQLNIQLQERGLGGVEQAREVLLDDEEVSKLEQKKQALQNAETTLNHSRQELNRAAEKQRPEVLKIAKSSESLANEIKEKEQSQKVCLGKKGSLEERLKADALNKAKQAEKVRCIAEQEKELGRWDALSQLIGDATGNKFSRFAQELTLQQVLHLANGHLKRLSDRYRVKHVRADRLDELFVIDRYHGDAQRSVKTLSGGESFLVSLSLALGLSDLAGQNTVIGSLFIDEGFGTLDQNTLDVALSALERLQSESNRTIGIISHVPALKERVTTQIELSKDASGYSTLTIRS